MSSSIVVVSSTVENLYAGQEEEFQPLPGEITKAATRHVAMAAKEFLRLFNFSLSYCMLRKMPNLERDGSLDIIYREFLETVKYDAVLHRSVVDNIIHRVGAAAEMDLRFLSCDMTKSALLSADGFVTICLPGNNTQVYRQNGDFFMSLKIFNPVFAEKYGGREILVSRIKKPLSNNHGSLLGSLHNNTIKNEYTYVRVDIYADRPEYNVTVVGSQQKASAQPDIPVALVN